MLALSREDTHVCVYGHAFAGRVPGAEALWRRCESDCSPEELAPPSFSWPLAGRASCLVVVEASPANKVCYL